MAAPRDIAELPIGYSCSLDLHGMQGQAARYVAIGRAARLVAADATSFTVELAAGADEQLVREAIAVESACCPFFAVAYEPEARRLRVGVSAPEQASALAALAGSLGLEPRWLP
jgi:hypothetical protein